MHLTKQFYLTILTVLFAGIISASAVPAYPRPITVTQSDGTQITIRITGDEYSHQITSSDGYALTGGADNDYYYATLDAKGALVSSGIKAKPLNKLTVAEKEVVAKIQKGLKSFAPSNLKPVAKEQSAPMIARAVGGMNPPGGISDGNTKGEVKSLIILVEFSDIPFTVASPQQAFTQLLTQKGYAVNGATGSASDYYTANSNGQFDPQFTVVGPYKISRPASYYAGKGGTENPADMVEEACKAADKDVNFTDYANGTKARDIFIFYSGYNMAEGAPNTVWPHRWDITAAGKNLTLDGVKITGYACSSEYKGRGGKTMAGIGTFCHEFGHVLGWPDFYDTDDTGSGGVAPGTEGFSLMCFGSYNNQGRTPPSVNIIERWMAGWAEPELVSSTGLYTLEHISKNKGYLINTETKNEYFLLEARGKGPVVWDNHIENEGGSEKLNGAGMIVYHIDYSTAYANLWARNDLNNNPAHECAKIVRSVVGAVNQPSKMIFPGANNITKLSSSSNSDYKAWSKKLVAANISGISVANDQVTMSIAVNSVGNEPRINISKAEYSVGETINLSVLDYNGGAIATTNWYVDNTKITTPTYVTTAGKHRLMAVISNKNGGQMQIIKYITVK